MESKSKNADSWEKEKNASKHPPGWNPSQRTHSMVNLADLVEDVMCAVKLDTEQLAAQSKVTKLM